MKSTFPDCQVAEGHKVHLDKWPTRIAPLYSSPAQCDAMLAKQVEQLSEQQQLLYASNSHALLLIFQAMDAAGKDGVIRHVMSGVNPQGCQVFSYKHPSLAELQHDFLWRTTRDLPERGRIGIFNRSYYEEVLITRVHPEILHSEGLADIPRDDKSLWESRFRSIANLEAHLHANGTRVMKFYLHLSPEEQRKRFLSRIDDPCKNWKFSQTDMAERRFWPDYMKAYEACLSATSTADSPWFIVPADDKPNARVIVSRLILSALQALDLHYPLATAERLSELKAIRAELMSPIAQV